MRQLKFPFSQSQAINLALPVELEDLLPRPPEEYLHQWFYLNRSRNSADILVVSVERQQLQPWLELKRKLGLKLVLTSDSFLLHSLTGPLLPVSDCWVTLVGADYLLSNLIEGGRLSGSFSFFGKHPDQRQVFLQTLKSQKDLPFFWLGPEKERLALDLGKDKLPFPEPGPDQDSQDWLVRQPLIQTARIPPLRLVALTSTPTGPVFRDVVLALIFLALVVGMTIPYFQIPEMKNKVETVTQTMNQLFTATCPDVRRIVDPVTQIKERLREKKQTSSEVLPAISVLKVMTSFVEAIPDTLVSSLEVTHFILTGSSSLFISGRLDNLTQLETLKTSLTNSASFLSVTVGDISFDKDRNVSFNLMLKLP